MFTVIFEVCPRAGQWDAYLAEAALLRPELERIDGFIDNHRYRSRRRDGWLLSLSTWRDEKALIRWRSLAAHHAVQGRARASIFADYRLRVGEVAADTEPPAGHAVRTQRLDETETGPAKALSIMEAARPDAITSLPASPDAAGGLVAWDAFDPVLTPGAPLLLLSWRDAAAAEPWRDRLRPAGGRVRLVRVVRDYGMFDRREAPQFHPPV